MNVLRWQEIVYPTLLLLSFMMTGSLLATYLLIERTRIILAVAAYFLLQTAAFALLVLATGIDPVIDIDSFRPWIIYTRAAMAVALFICVVLQMERVIRQR